MAGSAAKMRAYRGPKLLERGFRPFFLAAGVFAGVVMPVWVGVLAFGLEVPSPLAGRSWHIHEMLFGYLSAVLAGFLLTAIPNWTGRLPVVGRALGLLWAVWLAGRIAVAFGQYLPTTAAVVDSAFLVVFAALVWREVVAGKNFRNAPVCFVVSGLALANISFHVLVLRGEPIAGVERFSLALVAILISLIGGRIVPSFTRNWMAKNNISALPAAFDVIDKAGLGLGVLASLAWVVVPDHVLSAILFLLAGFVFVYRIWRWQGFACFDEWLVVILHIGYLWPPVWFFLMALTILLPTQLTTASALHALSAGAIGTMTMAVVTRASLGHSGQALTANRATIAIYMLIIAGAALRVATDLLPFDYTVMVSLVAGLWSAGFLLFVIAYGPLLTGRR